jgi:hypothetical protein
VVQARFVSANYFEALGVSLAILRAFSVSDTGVVISRASVLWRGLRPVGWGALIGLIGAVCLSGVLAALVALPEVPDLTDGAGAFHPLTFVGVLPVLTVVVVAASFIAVRRRLRCASSRD